METVSVKEACKITGLSNTTIYNLIREGVIAKDGKNRIPVKYLQLLKEKAKIKTVVYLNLFEGDKETAYELLHNEQIPADRVLMDLNEGVTELAKFIESITSNKFKRAFAVGEFTEKEKKLLSVLAEDFAVDLEFI